MKSIRKLKYTISNDSNQNSVQQACKEAHDQLQKKFGTGWNVVIGKAYGAATTAVSGNVLQFYYQGVYAVDIWKCEN